MSVAKLYTPELLGLAVEVSQHPPLAQTGARAEARSPTCGSVVAMDLVVNEVGRIEQLGMRVHACAVGQAAAAIFARHAAGRSAEEIGTALRALEEWLSGESGLADWPDLHLIAAAQPYPGRHGAILLPWRAAFAALSSDARAS